MGEYIMRFSLVLKAESRHEKQLPFQTKQTNLFSALVYNCGGGKYKTSKFRKV